MEHKHTKRDNTFFKQDEVDEVEYKNRVSTYKSVKAFCHECSPGPSGRFERLESPEQDDSAYHTLTQRTSSSHSFSKSSSATSSDRFPSEESLVSSSLYKNVPSSSKKVHSTLIRIQLGDEKKVSHEWYSEFTHQSQLHKPAYSSPLANRYVEYDSRIAQMKGNFVHKL